MANNRERGIRAELKLRDLFIQHGWEAKRGGAQGAGGSAETPDLLHNIPGVHVECKRQEAFSCVRRAMAQAINDAGTKEPTVFCSEPGGREWYVIMRAEDYFASKEIFK